MKRILLLILAMLLVAVIVAIFFTKPAPDHAFYDNFDAWPLVIAHQGGDGLWPGDTLYAFEQAAALGVDVLEMDLHISADDVLVLMHDETVDRTTDGSGALEAMTLAEIKQLDAGYRWSPDGGQTYPYRGQGITVPTLEEVFQAFPDTPMNIELKLAERDMAQPFCDLIRQYGMEDKVLVASFHDDAMTAFRQTCPEVATSASEGEIIPLVGLSKIGLGRLYQPTAQAVQVPEERSGIKILTNGFVHTAHGRNMRVDAWTINEVEDMEQMVELGVDGIITDYPERLLALLGRE